MRKIITLTLLLFSSLTIGQGLHTIRYGFTPRRIQNAPNVHLHLTEETKQILSKPFKYLGRGRQCFAFVSSDDRYVLKILRTDIYYPSFWMRVFPFPFAQKMQQNRLSRFAFIKKSFTLASSELKNQTGTMELHLGELKHPHFSITPANAKTTELTLIDATGYTYHLPLETTSFALQSKHPIWSKEFLKAVQNKELEKAKTILESLLKNIVERGEKGILNKDRSFLRNYGFDGKTTYQIDLGSFFVNPTLDPSFACQKSVYDSLDPIQGWLSEVAPDLLTYFHAKTEEMMNTGI